MAGRWHVCCWPHPLGAEACALLLSSCSRWQQQLLLLGLHMAHLWRPQTRQELVPRSQQEQQQLPLQSPHQRPLALCVCTGALRAKARARARVGAQEGPSARPQRRVNGFWALAHPHPTLSLAEGPKVHLRHTQSHHKAALVRKHSQGPLPLPLPSSTAAAR